MNEMINILNKEMTVAEFLALVEANIVNYNRYLGEIHRDAIHFLKMANKVKELTLYADPGINFFTGYCYESRNIQVKVNINISTEFADCAIVH